MTRPKSIPRKGGTHPGPRPRTFLSWLKSAQPSKVRLELADGDEKTLVVLERDGRPRYRDTIATCESLGALRVEGLNAEGETVGLWDLPRPDARPQGPSPYAAAEGDTETTRDLKAFAMLLADARRESTDALVRVVDLQTKHFAEERKAFSSTLVSMDRAMQRMQRLTGRYRVASPEDPDEGEPAEGEESLVQALGPMLQQAIASAVAGPGQHPDANGAAPKGPKS